MNADANDRHSDSPQSAGNDSRRKHAERDGGTEFFDGDTSRGPAGEAHRSGKQSPETRIGTKIAHYQITGLLGQGGMGVVFRAHDPMIERDVAVKLLSEEWSADERAVQRFLVEARSAGKLGHPNTVAIHELGQEGRSYYLVMEYVTGGAVEETLAEKGAYSVAEATQIAADACKGLAAAHAVGLVHRDVKPANLLRSEDGTIKVADFGLVKAKGAGTPSITSPGQIMGTPHFMSPEQCESRPVDARSDIYSLGATYYSLLTGANPYADTDSAMQVMYAHCNAETPNPRDFDARIPAACAAIIARSMAKSPDDRYQTAEEMLVDLNSVEGGAAKPETDQSQAAIREGRSRTDSPQTSRLHRNRWLLSLAALVVVAVVGVFAVTFFPPSEPNGKGPAQLPATGAMASAPSVQGVTDSTITFGTTTAYSGPSRDLGQNMVLGIQTCFSAVNDSGGIHGRKLELVVLDDGYEPDRAIVNMNELYDQREVFAVIGNVGTPTAKVTVPYALEHKRLFFAPYTGAGLLRQDPPDRYVFNYRASYADETVAMVRYFIDIEGLSPDQIAVFAQNDSYGDDGFHGVARALRDYDIRQEDLLRVGYERNSLQVTDAVARIVESRDNIRAIVMVPTYAVAARFIQQVKPTM